MLHMVRKSVNFLTGKGSISEDFLLLSAKSVGVLIPLRNARKKNVQEMAFCVTLLDQGK